MILIIKTNKEKLHDLEFVKPIEDILRRDSVNFFTRYYRDVQKGDMANCKKVIICGTSLKDNKFIEDINYFSFLRDENFRKPVLGICAGFQIIGMTSELDRQVAGLDIKDDFSGVLKKNLEIGYFHEKFFKKFLGLEGDNEVYHLHNNYVEFGDDFEVFAGKDFAQAVKHKSKEVYGVLFHPEVRQKEMIKEFVNG